MSYPHSAKVLCIALLAAACASSQPTKPPLPLCELPEATGPGELTRDIVFVVDVSDSSGNQSGGDVDGDGAVNEGKEDDWGRKVDDSIFALELRLVCGLVRSLNPQDARIGLVTFSGHPDESIPDASVWLAPTASPTSIQEAVHAIWEYGPWGRTNLMAGVRLGADVLAEGDGAQGFEQLLILISAGEPTLPEYNPNPVRTRETRANSELALAEAHVVGERGVVVHTYAVGTEAAARPRPLPQIAADTAGSYHKLHQPQNLAGVLAASTWTEE